MPLPNIVVPPGGLVPPPPPVPPVKPILPGVQPRPAVPPAQQPERVPLPPPDAPVKPIRPGVQPKPAVPPAEQQPERVPNKEPQAQQAPPQQAVPPVAQVQAQVQVQIRPAILPPQARQGGAGFGGLISVGQELPSLACPALLALAVCLNQITLIDGKPTKEPTDYSTAVRVRTSDHVKKQAKPAENEILMGLQLTPEPRLQWQQLVSVRVEKAIDDQGQKLTQVMVAAPILTVPGAVSASPASVAVWPASRACRSASPTSMPSTV